jgi:dTDP-4-amino-4,6-dideoxygalactose transaminase
MQYLGFNYRLTDVQCALGLNQLKKLGRFLKRRREIVDRYDEAFKEIEEVKTPREDEGAKSAWHIYVIRLDLKKIKKTRAEIFETLRAKGIGVQVHYIPVYYHPYYKSLGYARGSCPKAEDYYEGSITLPLFPKMSDEEVEEVIESVKGSITS